MKKIILLGAIAVLLAACSQDETLSVNRSDELIKISATSAATTRSAEYYTSSYLMSDIYVWATYNNSSPYIENEHHSVQTGGTCSSSNPHYWPSGGTLTFFATNKDEVAERSGNDLIIADYTVSTDVSEQEDLLYAYEPDVTKTTSGTVNLDFHHALSLVTFTAKNTNSNVYVEISEVGIKHINNQGTFSVANGEWSDLSGDVSNVVSPIGSGNLQALNGISSCTLSNATRLSTYTSYSKAMLVLPQSKEAYDASTNTDGFYFVLKCCVYNIAGETFNSSTDEAIFATQAEPKYVAIPADIDWQAGYHYSYQFIFGEGNGGLVLEDLDGDPSDEVALGSFISFDCSIDEFEEEEEEVYADSHGWVDLGLSVNWAITNLGAEDIYTPGNYYEWGEVTIWDYDATMKGVSITDFSGNPVYDAATALWGWPWRTPTADEVQELIDNASSIVWQEDYNDSGMGGYYISRLIYTKDSSGKITAVTPRNIFLVAGGYIMPSKTAVSGGVGSRFGYWTSTASTSISNYANFIDGGHSLGYSSEEIKDFAVKEVSITYGFNIRPVRDNN